MSKDLSKGGVQAELEKDTASLCGTKHYLNMLVDGGATIIRPYTQEDGYTKEMIDNFAKRGITHQKKGILTAGYTKLRVRFSPYDTVGWDETDYHQGDSMFHKIRIRLYCDGKLKQERDMSGPVDGGATQEVFLLTENGKWTVEAEPIAAGECATPDKKSDIAFVNLEPVPQGWEIESGIDEGEEDETKNFTNELKPLATVGLIGLGALVLTRLMKRRRSSKEAEDISTLYTHGKWRRPVRFRNLDDVNKYDGAIELQGYGFCPAKLGENLKIGDVLVWNNGYKSRILDIQPKGKQSLDLKTMTEDTKYKQGQEFERTIRKNRLVGVAQDYHKFNGVMIKDLPPVNNQKQSTYNPYEKMIRKRMGLSAEEKKGGFIPFEELEIGDVFVFKQDKDDKAWERFVLKSKEMDGFGWDDETEEYVDIYKFVIDPYKLSPVSDITGTTKGNTIVFKWTNPYEELALRKLQMRKNKKSFEATEWVGFCPECNKWRTKDMSLIFKNPSKNRSDEDYIIDLSFNGWSVPKKLLNKRLCGKSKQYGDIQRTTDSWTGYGQRTHHNSICGTPLTKVKSKYKAEFEAKTANYILFMDFLEEAFYDEDSEVYKARQELYPDRTRSKLTIYGLYRLYCFNQWKDELPARIEKREYKGKLAWAVKQQMAWIQNRKKGEGILSEKQFKNAFEQARRKYCIKYDDELCYDWMNYNGKIYWIENKYSVGERIRQFSTLKNVWTKKVFKEIDMEIQRKIMKGN